MKFICTKENLVLGLGRVVPLAGRNTQLPILSNVLLRLTEGVLYVTCTDLEAGIQATIPGKLEREGVCTVAARKLLEYTQQLPSENPITLELKKNALHLTTTGYQAHFPVVADDDFPLLPSLAASSATSIVPAPLLCRGLSATLFAAARDATRPEIHSVFVQCDAAESILRIAATDSFRLAEQVSPVPSGLESFSFLLPLATAQEIVRLFSDHSEVEVALTEHVIMVQGDGVALTSRLIEGKYPDYQHIIPQSFVVDGTIERDALIRALKTLLVFLPRDSRRVQWVVNPAAGTLALAVGGVDSGAGDVELPFAGEGTELEVLFNIQYLLDGLQYMVGEQCRVRLAGTIEPAVLQPAGEETGYRCVVMPIQA